MKLHSIRAVLSVLLISAVTAVAQEEVTKSFSRDFDVYDEVVKFTQESIEGNPALRLRYGKLVEAAGSKDDDRPPSPGARVAIKWLVPESNEHYDETGGTREQHLVFLVKQALSQPFHGGYSVDHNVVARIVVKTKESLIPDAKKEGEYVVDKVKAVFAFDGFVEVSVEPLGK